MNKVALSVNDDKKIQTPNEVISNLYGTGPGRVWKEELMGHPKIKSWI